jgi:hypothetical protein
MNDVVSTGLISPRCSCIAGFDIGEFLQKSGLVKSVKITDISQRQLRAIASPTASDASTPLAGVVMPDLKTWPLKVNPRVYPAIVREKQKVALLSQLFATAVVLGWVPGNLPKLALMLVIWAAGFRSISVRESLLVVAVNLFFVAMNSAALTNGVFRFDHPDFLAMPLYEYMMWGFYTLHAIRLLEGEPPPSRRIAVALAAVLFALPFATIVDPTLLLLFSSIALALCLVLFHEPMDWAYAGYMTALGALIEYVGVGTGQWHYPDDPYGGVPLWFLTMWAGVGLFTRRILLPLLYPARSPA